MATGPARLVIYLFRGEGGSFARAAAGVLEACCAAVAREGESNDRVTETGSREPCAAALRLNSLSNAFPGILILHSFSLL
jgi:hypothetical protein